MSVNIGHSHPKVRAAMKDQIDKLLYVFPGTATEVRARVSAKFANLVPGNINTFFYALGGAEANENAMKVVCAYTGRQKIISRYRSYYGAINVCM
jgi:taurine--2-oxoglutarate transaminase